MPTWRAAFDLGEFLPDVNPADEATWACLVRDLAQALTGHRYQNRNITWRRTNMGEDYKMCWILGVEDPDSMRASKAYRFNIDTDDPGVALVEAKIYCLVGAKNV